MADGVFQGDDKLAGTVAAMTRMLVETSEALKPLRG